MNVVRHFLLDRCGLAPTRGLRRVFLLREAELLTTESGNALLKTLEEPPGATTLILVTTGADEMLATIRSRCQRIPFAPLPAHFIAEQLTVDATVEQNAAALVAALADGSIGQARRWLAADVPACVDPLVAALHACAEPDPPRFAKTCIELAESLAKRTRDAEIAAAPDEPDADDAALDDEPDDDDLSLDGEEDELDNGEAEPAPRRRGKRKLTVADTRAALLVLYRVAAEHLRSALHASVGAAADLRAARLADQLGTDRLDTAIQALAAAEDMVQRFVSPTLACEYVAAALCGVPVRTY